MMFSRNNILAPRTVTRVKPQRSKKMKIFLWCLFLSIAGIFSWIAVTGLIAFNNIQAKNDGQGHSFFKFGDGIDPDSINEGDTRINTLIIGADGAAGLTDSLQIYSIDPINSTMAILSIPRDLYVNNPLGGKSKINEVYNAGVRKCRNNSECDPDVDAGAKALKEVIKETLGVNIHYFARADFQGFRRLIDAIGGVEITVETALYDPSFPCDNNPGLPCGYTQSAGTHLMNGTQALRYTRCRNGNCGNDFGRSARQQQVIAAMREKTLSLGVLSNPQRLTNIISTLGRNFKTDMKLDEILRISKINQEIDDEKTVTAVLDTDTDSPLKAQNNGSYIIVPRAGLNDWSEVQAFVTSVLPEPYIIKESAPIAIIDASGKKTGEEVEAMLKNAGYNVIINKTATSTQSSTQIWSKNSNPYTNSFIRRRIQATDISSKPTTDAEGAAIIIVIGTNYSLR